MYANCSRTYQTSYEQAVIGGKCAIREPHVCPSCHCEDRQAEEHRRDDHDGQGDALRGNGSGIGTHSVCHSLTVYVVLSGRLGR